MTESPNGAQDIPGEMLEIENLVKLLSREFVKMGVFVEFHEALFQASRFCASSRAS